MTNGTPIFTSTGHDLTLAGQHTREHEHRHLVGCGPVRVGMVPAHHAAPGRPGRGHPARPRRRAGPVPPAAPRDRAARPGGRGAPRDRRVRDAGHQARPRLGRARARPVRPRGRRRRRGAPVAHLLADPRPAGRPVHLDHGQGDPRRRGVQPPRPPDPARPDGPARPGRGRVRAAAADPRQAAAGHRRLRHHPGDRDAAQPVLPGRAPRHRHRAAALGALPLGGDLRRGAAQVRRGRLAAPDRAAHRHPRPARRDRPRRDGPGPGRAHGVRLRARRAARRPAGALRRP